LSSRFSCLLALPLRRADGSIYVCMLGAPTKVTTRSLSTNHRDGLKWIFGKQCVTPAAKKKAIKFVRSPSCSLYQSPPLTDLTVDVCSNRCRVRHELPTPVLCLSSAPPELPGVSLFLRLRVLKRNNKTSRRRHFLFPHLKFSILILCICKLIQFIRRGLALPCSR
jgi:hypothetical protein